MIIKDVDYENVNDLVNFCIPINKRNDPSFATGAEEKRKWALTMLKNYGEVAKLAYLNSKPVGMIQYQPVFPKNLIRIRCIFVPEKKYTRKGIGSALLNSLINDMKKPKVYFNNHAPAAIITNAFETPAGYSQFLFFRKKGFITVKDNLLYYPLKDNFIYQPPAKKVYKPFKKDIGKALIFYDPFCPFSLFFAKEIEKTINAITADLSIEFINTFEKPKEFSKRGGDALCIVNCQPINAFVLDKENFIKEVKSALKIRRNYEV
ncbi:MAG: GNAT family N-acetyltransferase [candidate division WOR-3 bacterium]